MKLTKLFSLSALSALTLGLLAGCSKSSDVDLQFIPAKESENEKWGLVDKTGKFLVSDEFENCPSWGYGGVFSVEEGTKGLRTLYHVVDGKAKVIKDYDNLKDCGRCSEGLIPVVRENERIKVIDKEGNEKFEMEPVNGKEIVRAGNFMDGRIVIKTADEKFGFLDESGKVAVKPVYDGVLSEFVDGKAILYKEKKEGPDSTLTYALSVVDRNGNIEATINGEFNYGQVYDKGLVLRTDKTFLLYDFKGERVGKLPSKVGYVGEIRDDYLIYTSEDGNVGVMTIEGEVVVRPKYDEVYWLESGDLLCVKDDNKGIDLVNRKGDIIKSVDYTAALVLPSFGVILKEDKDYYFFNNKLEGETKNYVREIGLEGSYADSYVRSDYIDPAGIASTMYNTFFDKATFTGKGVKIGAHPTQISFIKNEDPEDWTWRSNYKWNIESTNTYTIEAQVEFDSNIGKREYRTEYETYYGYTFSHEVFAGYAFNNAAEVVVIGMALDLDHHKKAMSVARSLMKQFDATDSMKKVESGKSGALYVEGTQLYVVAANNENNREVVILEVADTPLMRETLKRLINNEITEEDTEEAAAEEVVVEECVDTIVVAELDTIAY